MKDGDKNNSGKLNYTNHKYSFSFAFKQQLLQAWQPKPTLKCAITIYLIIGIIFFSIGILIVYLSNDIIQIISKDDYSKKCELGKTCEIKFEITETMEKPIYLYYRINGFYQNHRRYVKSVSYTQLKGNNLSKSKLDDCKPVVTNKDMNKEFNIKGEKLNPDDPAIPCGLIAKTYFNDVFKITSPKNIEISHKDIAWPDDKKYRFKNTNNLDKQWINMEDERFINWMRISAFTNFKKLWGIINEDLSKGTYIMTIQNNWDVSQFDGEKYFELSKTNILGGKNLFLGYSYIAVGSISLLLSLLFIIKKLKRPKGLVEEKLNEINN